MAAAAPTVESVVASLRADCDIGSELVDSFFLAPRAERRTSWEPASPAPMAEALSRAGVEAPWSHQAAAAGLADEATCEVYDGDTPASARSPPSS